MPWLTVADNVGFGLTHLPKGARANAVIGRAVRLTPAGQDMTQQDWGAGYAQSLAALLNGEAISEPDPRGGRIVDAKFLLLFNAHSDPLTFTLPEASVAAGWEEVRTLVANAVADVRLPSLTKLARQLFPPPPVLLPKFELPTPPAPLQDGWCG